MSAKRARTKYTEKERAELAKAEEDERKQKAEANASGRDARAAARDKAKSQGTAVTKAQVRKEYDAKLKEAQAAEKAAKAKAKAAKANATSVSKTNTDDATSDAGTISTGDSVVSPAGMPGDAMSNNGDDDAALAAAEAAQREADLLAAEADRAAPERDRKEAEEREAAQAAAAAAARAAERAAAEAAQREADRAAAAAREAERAAAEAAQREAEARTKRLEEARQIAAEERAKEQVAAAAPQVPATPQVAAAAPQMATSMTYGYDSDGDSAIGQSETVEVLEVPAQAAALRATMEQINQQHQKEKEKEEEARRKANAAADAKHVPVQKPDVRIETVQKKRPTPTLAPAPTQPSWFGSFFSSGNKKKTPQVPVAVNPVPTPQASKPSTARQIYTAARRLFNSPSGVPPQTAQQQANLQQLASLAAPRNASATPGLKTRVVFNVMAKLSINAHRLAVLLGAKSGLLSDPQPHPNDRANAVLDMLTPAGRKLWNTPVNDQAAVHYWLSQITPGDILIARDISTRTAFTGQQADLKTKWGQAERTFTKAVGDAEALVRDVANQLSLAVVLWEKGREKTKAAPTELMPLTTLALDVIRVAVVDRKVPTQLFALALKLEIFKTGFDSVMVWDHFLAKCLGEGSVSDSDPVPTTPDFWSAIDPWMFADVAAQLQAAVRTNTIRPMGMRFHGVYKEKVTRVAAKKLWPQSQEIHDSQYYGLAKNATLKLAKAWRAMYKNAIEA